MAPAGKILFRCGFDGQAGIVTDNIASVFIRSLALVYQGEHPRGAEQVIERCPNVPARTRGGSIEFGRGQSGDQQCRLVVRLLEG